MASEFLGLDEASVAATEAGDEEDAVGVEVSDAVGVEYWLNAQFPVGWCDP